MAKIFSVLTIILLIVTIFLITDNRNLKNRIKNLEGSPKQETPINPEGDIEVADYMHKLQIFSAKLYFAGQEGNQELVDFYLHELEETMEILEDANVVDEGIEISRQISAFGVPAIEYFEKMLEKEGMEAFESSYENLITSCNSCHVQTKHPFIKISKPTTPPFSNQIFSNQ